MVELVFLLAKFEQSMRVMNVGAICIYQGENELDETLIY